MTLRPILAPVLVASLVLAPAIACGVSEPPPTVPVAAPATVGALPLSPASEPSAALGAEPSAIAFPRDDGPHQALTEWWYYNGHLNDSAGSRYGFQLVVFKRQAPGGRSGYAGHVAVTNHQTGQFQYRQEISLPPPVTGPGEGFDVSTASVRAAGTAGNDVLSGATADYRIALSLKPGKPPALHGRNGYIGVAANEMSYYYSRTRLLTEGTLMDHGRTVPVTGEVWMDHQWGDFSLDGGGGWDWLGVQLSDGTDLMVSVIRNGAGEPVLTYGTLVGTQGEAEHLGQGRVRARATGQWASAKTGAVYPMGWVVEVADRGLELTVRPVVQDQELDTLDTIGRAYWEGEVRVAGAAGGNPVEGLGYVELTGYDRRQARGTAQGSGS